MSLTSLKELMVLSAIRVHPAHGYALAEMLSDGLGWTVGLTRPTIYAILRRIEHRGWTTFETERVGNFPERQVYNLTDTGNEAYRELLSRCAASEIATTIPLAALLAHLDDIKNPERQAALSRLRNERAELLKSMTNFEPHEGFAGAAITLAISQLELEIETIEGLLVHAK